MRRPFLRQIAGTATAAAIAVALPLTQTRSASAAGNSTLAVLLDGLGADLVSLYDGVRFLRIQAPGGRTITLTISCERQQWRVLRLEPGLKEGNRSRPDFREEPFQPAPGIQTSHWCTDPVRVAD